MMDELCPPSQNLYVEILAPTTSEGKLIWIGPL